MDDPNLMQTTTSISSDKKDNMTSFSPPKRTIVLGVVNTTGMKSTNVNRKRRWDQPPEDISGPPTLKKLCISENEAFPVKETESLEATYAVSPNFDRINSQCDNISGLSNQSTHPTLVENEEISIDISHSHSSDISSEASAMSIDLPADKSDKYNPPPCEPHSDVKSCSDSNENLSEVNILESCDRLQCVGTVNSNTGSRFTASDVTHSKETTSISVSDTKMIKYEQKSNISATVLSHQSDELRRIMFSYDEGSSDSDTMESSKEDNADKAMSSNKIDDCDENIISVCPSNISPSDSNKKLIDFETSDTASERVSLKDTAISGNDIDYASPVSIINNPFSIQPEYNSNETDAFLESSKSLENLVENKGSPIESQCNIPNKNEVEITTDREIECDLLANKTLNKNVNVEVDTILHSIHNKDYIENVPQTVTLFSKLRHLGSDNQNSAEDSVIIETEFINTPPDQNKKDRNVKPVGEVVTATNNIEVDSKFDEKVEGAYETKESSRNCDYTEENKANSPDETQQKNLTNEESLKINNLEAAEKHSGHSVECDISQLELDNPNRYKLQLKSKTIPIEKLNIDISDDKKNTYSSSESYVTTSVDLNAVNENYTEKNAFLRSFETNDFVKCEEISSKVIVAPETVVSSSESTNKNRELVLGEELRKGDAGILDIMNPSSVTETINLGETSNHHPSEVIIDVNLENIVKPDDSQSDTTNFKTPYEKSSLLKLQDNANEVYMNDRNILISNMPQETNLKVTDSLCKKDINKSIDVTPSDNIDPAVMEVIVGSNEGTANIKEVMNDCLIISRTSESDLKTNVSELDDPEFVSTNINFEDKMDITNETNNSLLESEKSVLINKLICTANPIKSDVDRNMDSCLESDLILDNNSKLTVEDTDSGIVYVTEVKEIVNPDNSISTKNTIDTNNALNVVENDISTDHYSPSDFETVKSCNSEHEISVNSNSEQPSNVSISEIQPISKRDQEIEEEILISKDSELSINTVVDTMHLKSIEIDELSSKTDEMNETDCHKIDTVEHNNTVISSVDDGQTELRSVENNDFEISTEETVETEISIEDNVESKLCPLDSDGIVTVEASIIDSSNDLGNVINLGEDTDLESSSVENVMTVEHCDDEIHVTETNAGGTDGNKENPNIIIEEEMAETENIFLRPIEIVGHTTRRTLERGLKFIEDGPENSAIEKISSTYDSAQDILKELVIQEDIAMDEDSVIEECAYDNANLAVREDDIVLTSVDSPSYVVTQNPSLEESKIFEKSIDVSETISEEMGIDCNVIIEPVVEETKTIAREIDLPKIVPSVEISSELSYVEESILEGDSKTLTEDIEESFVVEEVVTCESPESIKDVDNEFGSVNEDISCPLIVFEETCETTESFVNNEINAVMKENTVDSDISAIDNQNEISNDSKLDFKKYDHSTIVESVKKHITIGNINEPSMNSIKAGSPSLDMECESSVNSIIKTDSDLEMDIVEPLAMEKLNEGHKIDSIKVDRPPPPLLNIESDLSSITKDIGINVPLLTTVNNSAVLKKDKPTSTSVVDSNRSGSIPVIDPKLEPITLRIYKDNLSIRTDDLDSPKKNRSPKLSSELKSQLSPHIKSPDSRSSLSPTTKKLEFTLKIAKDVNTNIPRATMSPKNSVSPSNICIHKPGDILRAELTAESGRSSPAYMNPSDSGLSKVKLKIQKPGLSKDYISHIQSSIKEETTLKADLVDHSSGISLPKPSLEIGNVFKKMMETENNVSKGEINVVDHSLNSPLLATPISIPVVRKRGRPRKILQKVLTGSDANFNSNLIPGHSPGLPFNLTPGLDVSSGVESSDQSSRQVRSCRARTKPIVVKTRKPRGGGARGGMRGRGAISSGVGGIVRNLAAEIEQDKLAGKLSEREKAELAKIEERKERQRQERHAKNEAKKAKKLARKLKDEERRLKKLREKAEKAEAAAPQVFEEETRMSAADGHTPAPASALSRLNQTSEHNEESQNSISTPTSSQIKRGRMEIPIDPECKEVRVEHLAEYQWQGSELFMIQEQVSLYLGVKSFKRKYPDLKRRPVEAEERTFLEDSGLVPKSMCDLGLTAVSSAEILDIMYQDFPDKYEEFRKYVREKQAKEASFKQKAVFASLKHDRSKGEPREQALEAVAMWNSNLNRERREERRCALDLQTFTVHYPKQMRDRMARPVPKSGLYPVSLIPGQFSDSFKVYTPTELMYFPLNTVMYGPLKPNERQPMNPSDGSGSDSSSSTTSDDSSSSSSECESEDENTVTRECKICNGEKKTNRESHPEILLQCSNCKGLCHPTCQEITPEMLPHIKKYNWHCSNCKKCMICKNTTKDDKMLFCDLCDRGYHIHCVGLRKAPEGRWHCSVCSFCTVCGSKDPGGPEWNYEYKKTDKGVRLYQRTLCVPCSKNALM